MLDNFFKSIISSDLMRAKIKNGLAAASVAAGAWTLSHLYDWLQAHITYFSGASNMAIAGTVASAVAAIVLTVGSAIYSTIVDPNNVNAKSVAIAATGNINAASDAATVKAAKVEIAAAPGTNEAVAALTAKLSEGKV